MVEPLMLGEAPFVPGQVNYHVVQHRPRTSASQLPCGPAMQSEYFDKF